MHSPALRDSFKPTMTNACSTYRFGPAGSYSAGGAPPDFCTGAGYGAGGAWINLFKICTDSSASCINLTMSPLTLSSNSEITLYTTCSSSGGTSGYVNNSYKCLSNSSGSYSTEGLGLSANTCYTAKIWTKDTGTFQICRQLNAKTC
jgi:hypothetical protein